MNKLNLERKTQIIKVLCEGNSIRSTARITDSAINTVVKLLKEVGSACLDYQDKVMHNIPSKKLMGFNHKTVPHSQKILVRRRLPNDGGKPKYIKGVRSTSVG